MLRSVAGPYLWQGERDRETKRDRVEQRKRERRVVCKGTQWRDHIQRRGK